mmetsp:Transcript_567/g.990  ORF Transcript_567/g.990 Transcript_567/m.990 type:complete len:326 (+) Transcript_567:128-1105(+)|eukprot:CAMPEP_0114253504 /NCGR_PEP_ID=MMETSP0058-20121206/16431_1 /TAXON_ID=36894 /ORGANISM="Pyramimonas parkeae, CCMP726" /LENGTH=325 /DNA_ID=CAMNT_0001367561 /DNA_START=111 /DNA_END=1088 /DNA_ORIENTATION=+
MIFQAQCKKEFELYSTVKLLQDSESETTADMYYWKLHSACQNLDFLGAQDILNLAFSRKLKSQFGRFFLHLAAIHGHTSILRTLLEFGWSVHAADDRGVTPLHLASFRGDAEMVSKLIESGANVNCRDVHGRQPLAVATFPGHLRAVVALLHARANVMAKDDSERSALDLAAARGHKILVRLLIQFGADPALMDFQERNTTVHMYEADVGTERCMLTKKVVTSESLEALRGPMNQRGYQQQETATDGCTKSEGKGSRSSFDRDTIDDMFSRMEAFRTANDTAGLLEPASTPKMIYTNELQPASSAEQKNKIFIRHSRSSNEIMRD